MSIWLWFSFSLARFCFFSRQFISPCNTTTVESEKKSNKSARYRATRRLGRSCHMCVSVRFGYSDGISWRFFSVASTSPDESHHHLNNFHFIFFSTHTANTSTATMFFRIQRRLDSAPPLWVSRQRIEIVQRAWSTAIGRQLRWLCWGYLPTQRDISVILWGKSLSSITRTRVWHE